METRKKTGPRPLPLRDTSVTHALLPVEAGTASHRRVLARSAALALAASTLLACGGATTNTGVEPYPTACQRLAGAPMQIEPPVASASATPTTPHVIEPLPITPPLAGGIAPSRE